MAAVPGGVRRDKRRGRAAAGGRGAALIGALLLCVVASGCSWQTTRVDLDPRPPAQTSWVLASDGTVLTQLHADEDREIVSLATMPKVLVDAVVDTEDARFFEHTGVDLKAVLRAIKANASNGKVVEGGSTITQQYVKNTFVGDDRSAKRKIEEARAAWELEHKLTKSRILELYLNSIYFGNGSYGVQAASRQYFGTTVDKLTLAQAAMLAGVIHSPAALDPFVHPDAALARRREVLDQMAEIGSISKADADAATAQPLTLRDRSGDARYPAAYFVEEAKRFILDDPAHTGKFGATPDARQDLLFRGGLRITTTVDLKKQAEAEAAVAAVLTNPAAGPAGALVSIEPKTGYVRALVGGRDFFGADPQAKFDLAVQGKRQAGSSFKPFVLAAALEQGISLKDEYPAPSHIDIPLPPAYQPPLVWSVNNAENEASGRINLIEATVHSVNTVYAQLMAEVGPEKAMAEATKLGIQSPLAPNYSAVLGTNDVSPLEMADAYATFANGGVKVPPTIVTRVTTADGTVLYEAPHVQSRVLDPALSAIITEVLREVVVRGTGRAAALDRPAAGKTGTTEDFGDAWFVGYTPQLATSVWVGYPKVKTSMRPPATPIAVFGGTWPAQIWHRYMTDALGTQSVEPFPQPPLVQPGASSTTSTTAPTRLANVPNVTRLSSDEAGQALQNAGFNMATQSVPDDFTPIGSVIDQNPPPGSQAPPGSTVVVEISTGPSTAVIPDVLGRPDAEARQRLLDAGFGVTAIAQSAPPGAAVRPGEVWRMDPPPSTRREAGTVVTITVQPGGG